MFFPSRRSSRLAAAVAVMVLPLSFAACSTQPGTTPAPETSAPSAAPPASDPSAVNPNASTAPSESASASAAAEDVTFGSGCASVPKTGKGSFAGMAQDRVATAASNNDQLSTLVKAVKAAKLVDTLNNAEDITVFAPNNNAFGKIKASTLAKLLAKPSKLSDVLTMHVVKGQLTPADLAGSHKTLNGKSITVEGSGEDFTVNGNAKVVCGNVQTANATVYIIDSVLMP